MILAVYAIFSILTSVLIRGKLPGVTALDTATEIDDMDIPGFGLHPLKGDRKGQWAVKVSGNWRITFEFRDGNAYLLEYEDYH